MEYSRCWPISIRERQRSAAGPARRHRRPGHHREALVGRLLTLLRIRRREPEPAAESERAAEEPRRGRASPKGPSRRALTTSGRSGFVQGPRQPCFLRGGPSAPCAQRARSRGLGAPCRDRLLRRDAGRGEARRHRAPRRSPRLRVGGDVSASRCCAMSVSPSSPIRTSGRSRCFATQRCSSSSCCALRSPRTWSSRTPPRTTCSGGAPARCSSTSAPSSARRGRTLGGIPPVLLPCALSAHAPGVCGPAFQPWLRGSLDGIEPAQARAILRGRHLLRRGVFTHVALHARLERREADRDTRAELRRAGFRRELIEANARKLERLVRAPSTGGHQRRLGRTTASARTTSPTSSSRRTASFAKPARAASPSLAWDLGCNDGRYSRIAAEHARPTWSRSTATTPPLRRCSFRTCGRPASEHVLPLVMDLADPSPARGWRGRERAALEERGRPDLVLCLALMHHLSIGANVPLRRGR